MADNLNELINQLDKRLRILESKPMSSNVISRLMINGGDTGNFLVKNSSTDYDITWSSGGYFYFGTVYFTSTSTFYPNAYPNLKGVMVRLVGGGGGGGGCASTTLSSQSANGGGGGGGGYSESFIGLNSSSSNITVTVGAGGAGGTAGNNAGSAGGNTSFGSYLSATGGSGGGGDAASTAPVYGAAPGAGGSGSSGSLNMTGMAGLRGFSVGSTPFVMYSARGGSSQFSRTPHYTALANAGGNAGSNGTEYGMGGGGGNNAGIGAARAGGDGSSGIVIVDVFV